MEKNVIKTIEVGFKNGVSTNAREALRQMMVLCKYDLDVVGLKNEKLQWGDIYGETDRNKLFSVIYQDRKIRKKEHMADRPPFLIGTIIGNQVIRLEFYYGHDKLEKIYDFRHENYQDDNSFEEYTDHILCPKDYIMEMLGVQEAHDTSVMAEIEYLRIRNTITFREHTEEMTKLFRRVLCN